MSIGWIKTEEQRERHKARCRAYYRSRKDADPSHNSIQWQKRKAALKGRGEYESYMERSKVFARQSYARNRKMYLRPDIEKREVVLVALGGKCVHCGFSEDTRALVLDHKNSDGYADRKRVGSKLARYYVNHLEDAKERLQVLCCNCNAIKAIDKQEHNRTRRVQ